MEQIDIVSGSEYVNLDNVYSIVLKEKSLIKIGISIKIKKNRMSYNVNKTYRPFYFVNIEALCDRPPFKPKKVYYVIYIDAVSGRYGLTYVYPNYSSYYAKKEDICSEVFTKHKIEDMLSNIIEKLILRKYVIKRPSLKILNGKMVYIPYYEVKCDGNDIYLVNILSGEVNKKR